VVHLRSRNRSADAIATCGLAVLLLDAGCIVQGLLDAASDASTSMSTSTTSGGVDAIDPTGEAASSGEADAGPLSTGTAETSSGANDQRDPSAPPPANPGDCCEPARGTGCGDRMVEACVCAADPRCCTDAWDELCVDHIEELACGGCSVGKTGSFDDCCSPHDAPACIDDGITSCVCAADPYCCDVVWDQVCVDAIGAYGCGVCPGPYMPDDCCTPGEVAGCPDPEISECVCAQDPYCCDDHWDELCVDEATSYCGGCYGDEGTTGDPPPPGDCCVVGGGPGCIDAQVAMCVCAVDQFCCEQQWDGACVGEVDMLGCGACDPGNATTTDDGGTSSSGGAMTY